MKKIFLLLSISMLSYFSYSQSDSTDLNVYTTPPTLMNQMDSLIYGNGGYEDYHLEFTVTDTTNFGSVSIEFSTTSGQVMFRHTYNLSELQAQGLIDGNWSVHLDFGKFETSQNYKASIVIGNYTGVLDPSLSKIY